MTLLLDDQELAYAERPLINMDLTPARQIQNVGECDHCGMHLAPVTWNEGGNDYLVCTPCRRIYSTRGVYMVDYNGDEFMRTSFDEAVIYV